MRWQAYLTLDQCLWWASDVLGNATTMAGSPKRIQVRRTSGSVILDLAVKIAWPRGSDGFAASVRNSAWSMDACGGAVVKPEDAHTATAPPFGAISSDVERLVAYTSWKNPFRQSMSKNTGRRPPFVNAATDLSSSKSANDHCSSDPCPV